jgi:putative DNA primase/helicase
VGLDDFLVRHGAEAFRQLLAAAREPEPVPKELRPREAPDDPHRLARLFLAEKCQHADSYTLRFFLEEWYRWVNGVYRVVPEKELRGELTVCVKNEFDRLNLAAQKVAAPGSEKPTVRKVTGRLVADVAHALASLTLLPGRAETPFWLGTGDPWPTCEVLACCNGLVHLPSLVAGQSGNFRPPTPLLFSTACLDFAFDPHAPRPTAWLEFLNQLWEGDSASIATLQEFCGYFLTPDTRQQKILLLVGPKRGGKGTIARVIRGLIGPENVAGPTLSGLGTNFGLWPLLGKSLAIIHDARLSGRSDAAAETERLLSITGEDAHTIDRKNLPPVTSKLSARFLLLTNELPRLLDSSGALASRFVVLRLTRSWYGKEDPSLTDRILGERPGILLWAIAGWQRLRERGHFLQPDAGKELAGELEDLASPVGAFVRDCCLVGPEYQVSVADLFGRWRVWCERKGRKEPGTEQTFGRDLLAAVPTLQRVQPRDGESRFRAYRGIGLRQG